MESLLVGRENFAEKLTFAIKNGCKVKKIVIDKEKIFLAERLTGRQKKKGQRSLEISSFMITVHCSL